MDDATIARVIGHIASSIASVVCRDNPEAERQIADAIESRIVDLQNTETSSSDAEQQALSTVWKIITDRPTTDIGSLAAAHR